MVSIKRDIHKGILRDFSGDYRVFFELATGSSADLRVRRRNEGSRFLRDFNLKHSSNGFTPVMGDIGVNLNIAVGYAQQFENEFTMTSVFSLLKSA